MSATAKVGLPFSYQITATGSPDHFYATGFPLGIRIDIPSGLISGTFAQSGTYTWPVSAINAGGSVAASLQIVVTDLPPVITSPLTAFGESGRAFQYQITSDQKISSYTASGLPVGLGFNAATGLISGTPSGNGTFLIPVSISNSGGTQSVTLNLDFYSLQPVITSPLLVTATAGAALNYQIRATGNPESYDATVLPAGLSVNHSTGLISGTLAAFPATRVLNWGNSTGYGLVPPGLNDAVAVAASNTHNLAIRSDGTVVGWGSNYCGETTIPIGLNNVVAVAAGYFYFSLALKGDGTLVAWGSDTGNRTSIPVGLHSVTSIGLGSFHCLAAKQDGTVAAWGDNYYGQCNVPPGLSGVVAVAAGGNQNLALKSDGTVEAWGVSNSVPTGLNRVVAIAVGACNLALKNDGTLIAWGGDASGIPANLNGIVAISPSLALKSDGTLVSLTGSSTMPAGLDGVIAIADGMAITHQTSLQLSASNPYGSGTANLVLQGLGSVPQITPPPSLTGTCGEPFNLQIMASHFPTSYSASGLPTGLCLDPATGAISGFPSGSGSYGVTLQAANTTGTGTAWVHLNFQPTPALPPTILSNTGTITTTGTLFHYQIVASHFPVNYSATGLPEGMSLDPITGIISGTYTTSGSSNVTISAANSFGTGTAQLNLIAPPFFTSSPDVYIPVGFQFGYNITADNASSWFTVSGLPSWASGWTSISDYPIPSTSFFIQGTPATVGTTEVSATVSNAGGNNSTTLRIHAIMPDPPVITTPSWVVTATNQYPFSYQLTTSSSTAWWNVTGLPAWASFYASSSSNLISGIPTETGTTLVTINQWNVSGSDHRTLAIIVEQAPPTLTSAPNASVSSGAFFSYQITGNRSATGFSASGLPSWASFDPITGIISGTPQSPGKYSVSIGASNSAGTSSIPLSIHIYANPVLEKIYQFSDQTPGCSSPVLGSDGALYGTTTTGGANNQGSVFRVTTNGVMTELHSFSGNDGSSPTGLTRGSDGAFYGVTPGGGSDGYGTVFKITSNGEFSTLYNFVSYGSAGVIPAGKLALGADGALYGVTSYSGWQPPAWWSYYTGNWDGVGSAFKITASESLTIIASLPNTPASGLLCGTDGYFYGAWSNGNGSIYQLKTDASFNSLFTFNGGNKVGGSSVYTITNWPYTPPPSPVNSTGLNPGSSLVQGDDGALYGATNYLFVNPNYYGGGSGSVIVVVGYRPTYYYPGTVFKLTTDGSLQSSFNFPQGVTPNAMALASDGGIYGTTDCGGASGNGSVFRVDSNGQASDLFSFDGASLGGTPKSALTTGSDGNLYGANNNTLFRLRFVGPLVTTLPVDTVTNTTANLNGSVDPNGSNITVCFAYGTSPTLAGATVTTGTSIGVGAGIVPLHVPLNGLVMGTTYYYRAVVASSSGTYFGSILSFNAGQPAVTSSLSITGTQSVPFSYQIVGSNTPTSFAATGLPGGLYLDPATGLITGVTWYSGPYSPIITVANASGSTTATLALNILIPQPAITSSLNATGMNGNYFSYHIVASNSPTAFNAESLPSGLSVTRENGLISGAPTVSGTFNVTLQAINATGTGSALLQIIVNPQPPVITSPLTSTWSNASTWNYQITARGNPTSFTAQGLPAGLSLDSQTGIISGFSSSSGNYSCRIGATNADGTGWAYLTLNFPIVNSYPILSGTLQLTGPGLSGSGLQLSGFTALSYSTWSRIFAQKPGFKSGAAGVNNSAGIPNALAYSLGVNPWTATVSNLPKTGVANDQGKPYLSLSFSWDYTASDSSWTVEATSDLSHPEAWTPIANGTRGTASGFVTLSGSANTQAVLVRDTLPMSSPATRFLRLKVTNTSP